MFTILLSCLKLENLVDVLQAFDDFMPSLSYFQNLVFLSSVEQEGSCSKELEKEGNQGLFGCFFSKPCMD